MTFRLTIKCDNAAFDPPEVEIARLLRIAAYRVEQHGSKDGCLLDINGHSVGEYKLAGKVQS